MNVFPHKHFSATSCPGQIYGSQKDVYIERAQYWHDKMCGGSPAAPPSSGTSPSATSGTIDSLARRVIAGEFGNGEARKKTLGSNYSAVQARVNKIPLGQIGHRLPAGTQRPSAAEMRWRVAFPVSGRSGPIAKILQKIAKNTGRFRTTQ